MATSIYNPATNQYTNPVFAAPGQGTSVTTDVAGVPNTQNLPTSPSAPVAQQSISADNIGTTKPYVVPQPTTSFNPTPTVAAPQGTTSGTNGDVSVNPLPAPVKSAYQDTLSKIGALGDTLATKGSVTTQLQNDNQLATKTTQAAQDYNAYNQAKLLQQQTLAKMNETNPNGSFGGGRQIEINDYTRKSNADLANLAVISQSSQGLLSAAEKTIQDKLTAQFQPIEDQINFYTKFAQLNSNDLTDSEKYKLDQIAQQKKADLTAVNGTADDLHKALLANKAPAAVYSALDKVTNDFIAGKITAAQAQSDMYKSIGNYGGDKLRAIQYDNAVLTGKKLQQEISAGQPVTGEYAPVINAVSGLVGATKAPAVKSAISNAIAGGDFSTAYANIANAVEDSLTGTNKTKFSDTRTDIGVMAGMRDAIKAYTDAGGSLGYLKGKADTIAKNFGQLATDPKFAALGVQLQREFQAYRLAMTGAAFSPAESKEYAAVNPRTDASLDLNLATIDGALAQLTNRVTSTVNQRIPNANKIYDLANNSKPTTTGGSVYNGITLPN